MRADPDLCFLERVGMPDVTALSAEQGGGEGSSEVTDRCVTLTCFLLRQTDSWFLAALQWK